MKYSRSQINKVGQVIASEQPDIINYAEAIGVVDLWRKNHLPILEQMYNQVSNALKSNNIDVVFSSQRLKRMTSIISKLKRNPQMRLGGVQDIGGARFVFKDIETLIRAKEFLLNLHLKNFICVHEPYDYVTFPKDSGYRSIHFVYKFNSEDDTYNGMRVELQIRTQLQHDWATAVETAELISKSQLKAGLGDNNWLDFFKLVGSIFAKKECCPVSKQYALYTDKDYCQEYKKIEEKNYFLNRLQALVGAVKTTQEYSFNGGYAVIVTNYERKEVTLKHFDSTKQEEANALYSQIENTLTQRQGAVVLVSVSDIKELMNAYPSYFLNAKEFIDALEDFSKWCKLQNYWN